MEAVKRKKTGRGAKGLKNIYSMDFVLQKVQHALGRPNL
jgi:hypothetical protein